MQVELKAKYLKLDKVLLVEVAKEATRLEVVGIKSRAAVG